ncbi:MAG TPA: site-specific integrase [Acidimicrobiales bacterium]|nr:site-specific integrase [Acidimicrobiales bacterium]
MDRNAPRSVNWLDWFAEQEATPASTLPITTRWGPDTTINDAIGAWRTNGWDDLSPSTTRRYESIIKVHIAPTIGRRRIAELSPYDVETFFRNLKSLGLSRSSVRQTRAILARAFRLARRWSGNTLPNPISETELPVWSLNERPSVRSPTPQEVRALMRESKTGDLHLNCFLRVIVATGMRRGEACALRWSDIDWEDSTIRIDESIVADKGHASIKLPKTSASIRSVAVDTGTLETLSLLRVEQGHLAEVAEVEISLEGFVFSYEPGGAAPPYPDTLSRGFIELRKLAAVAPGYPSTFTPTLSSHHPRSDNFRASEAVAPWMVDRSHGSSLHGSDQL